jgi:hypothetical protein
VRHSSNNDNNDPRSPRAAAGARLKLIQSVPTQTNACLCLLALRLDCQSQLSNSTPNQLVIEQKETMIGVVGRASLALFVLATVACRANVISWVPSCLRAGAKTSNASPIAQLERSLRGKSLDFDSTKSALRESCQRLRDREKSQYKIDAYTVCLLSAVGEKSAGQCDKVLEQIRHLKDLCEKKCLPDSLASYLDECEKQQDEFCRPKDTTVSESSEALKTSLDVVFGKIPASIEKVATAIEILLRAIDTLLKSIEFKLEPKFQQLGRQIREIHAICEQAGQADRSSLATLDHMIGESSLEHPNWLKYLKECREKLVGADHRHAQSTETASSDFTFATASVH